MRKIVVKCFANMLGFYIAAWLLPAITLSSFVTLVKAGIVLGIVNFFIRPVLKFLSFPLTFLTLGTFLLVVNTVMVVLTASLVGGLSIPTFFLAFETALVISVTNFIVDWLV